MDPIDVNDEHINALREQVDGVLRGIDEKLSMHDFRVVDGERQINLILMLSCRSATTMRVNAGCS